MYEMWHMHNEQKNNVGRCFCSFYMCHGVDVAILVLLHIDCTDN